MEVAGVEAQFAAEYCIAPSVVVIWTTPIMEPIFRADRRYDRSLKLDRSRLKVFHPPTQEASVLPSTFQSEEIAGRWVFSDSLAASSDMPRKRSMQGETGVVPYADT